jgi:DNA modification methylase
LYLWYADGHAAAAAAAAAAAGYQIVAQIIWAKNHAQFVTSARYKGKHEPCYYAHRKGKTARWYGPNNEVTLWEYPRAASNDYHPTQKPVAIASRAISNSTGLGHIILDPFLGSGTTMVAAEQLGRRCYGIEIEPRYVDVSVRRWCNLTGKDATREADGASFAQLSDLAETVSAHP